MGRGDLQPDNKEAVVDTSTSRKLSADAVSERNAAASANKMSGDVVGASLPPGFESEPAKTDTRTDKAAIPSNEGGRPDPGDKTNPKITPSNPEQVPKDTVTPAGRTTDRGVDQPTRASETARTVEQPRTSSDGTATAPKTQNLEVQPTSQRPAELPNQTSAAAPERLVERQPPVSSELPSDKAHLPGLAIVGPEGKTQQGSVPSIGTSDGKVHDPVAAKPQEQAFAKPQEPAVAKSADVVAGKGNDTGLRGGELGAGALTGKIQAGPDHIKNDDAIRQAGRQLGDAAQRPENGASVLKNYQAADGVRSGIDHTNQGIVSKGLDGRSVDGKSIEGKSFEGKSIDGKSFEGKSADSRTDGFRSGHVPLTEGKIADSASSGIRSGDVKLTDGKISDGKTADGKASDGKAGNVKGPEGKVGGGTGAPGFIQFIENQAGIRGFGVPAKSDGGRDGKADGGKATIGPDGKPLIGSDTKGGVGIPGAKSNAIDGFLGLVETVKDNIKGTLKNLGDRTQPAISLKEGELAVVALRGKMPPLRDDISSVQIIAVLIPKGFVNWSIVRAPGIRPSDSPLPVVPDKFGDKITTDGKTPTDGKTGDGKPLGAKSADGKSVGDKPTASNSLDNKQGESKPFDINNPEVKSRPFIQLHGVDSNYTGPVVRRYEPAVPVRAEQVKVEPTRVEPVRVEPVKAEPLTDTKIAATAAGAAPYIDVPNNNQIVDQSSTRKSIQLDPKERRRLMEEQEHTLQSGVDTDSESNEKSKEKLETDSLERSPAKEGERRLRYVNPALDAQEETWNSSDEEANNSREMPAPLGRYTYIVRAGDTVESVAVVELNDLTLAPLLFSKNKQHVLPEVEYGRHPLVVGVVIDLPSPAEIKAFRGF
ncbi:hypothetical protein BH11CYA1_BH11CYA1_35220 [soil metagenome]